MKFVEFMISSAGRLLRVIAGAVIIWLALRLLTPPWSIAVALVGLVPIAAGAFNFCFLGPLFGADFWGRPKSARG